MPMLPGFCLRSLSWQGSWGSCLAQTRGALGVLLLIGGHLQEGTMWLLQGGVLEVEWQHTEGMRVWGLHHLWGPPAFPLSLLHCFEPLRHGQFPVLLISCPRPPALHPGHLQTSLHWLSDAQAQGGCFSLSLPTPTLAFEKQRSLSHSWPTGRQRGVQGKRGVGGLSQGWWGIQTDHTRQGA